MLLIKRQTRRGKRNKHPILSLYYVNINGFKSKSLSLENIILSLDKPDVVVLCEIKTVSPPVIKTFFEKMGYDVILKRSAGLLVAAKTKFDMVDTTSTSHENILTGSLKVGGTYISITAVYGLQETEDSDTRSAFYDELGVELEANDNRENQTILVGDFNAKLSFAENIISPNSANGSLLHNFINQYSLNVLNFNHISCGKWTRVQNKKGVIEKSVLDYVLARDGLSNHLRLFSVDETKIVAPFWIRKSKDGTIRQHSDHNSIYSKFSIPRLSTVPLEKRGSKSEFVGWRLSQEGLRKFKEITDNQPEIQDVGVHKISTTFSEQLSQAMDECFTRKKSWKRNHPNVHQDKIIHHKSLEKVMKILIQYVRSGKSERLAARPYIEFIQLLQNDVVQKRRADKVSNILHNISDEDGQLAVDKFWKLKRSLSAADNTKASIISRSNVELFSPPAIINEYRNEFVSRLSHRKIDSHFSKYEIATNKLFQAMYNASLNCNSEPDFTHDEVSEVLSTLSSGSPGSDRFPPDIFRNAGHGLISNITLLVNAIKSSKWIPAEWLDLIIVTIFKNKGSRKRLEYYRGIFLCNILPKIFEKLVKQRIKTMLAKVNILQAGSRTNRGPSDSLFLLNGMIDHAKYLKKQLFLTFYDYSTCFDSLWLEDSMISLWNLGVQNELFAMIYKLNENSNIRVKTPFGMSEYFSSPRIVKQGSVLSSNLCSSSTAELCDTNITGGTMVGSLFISNLLFVDDTFDANEDPAEMEKSHNEVMNFSDSKRLGMNYIKCALVTLNKKTHYKTPTLLIGDEKIAQVDHTKFLGDIINEKGTNVHMIDDKVTKARAAMVNSLALCSELTLGVYLMKASIVMYNSVFLATLLFNCQAWTNLTKTDIKKLETVQVRFLKRSVHSPLSTTNSFTFLEFGALPASYIIQYRQLSFLYHILTLDHNDPVKVMYHEQKTLPYEKNWANHMQQLLLRYNFTENEVAAYSSKKAWKKKAKTAVCEKAFEVLAADVAAKSKTSKLSYESLNQQSYLCQYQYKDACTIFKLRSRSVDCKGNHKSMAKQNLLCRLCAMCDETQRHIINCPASSDGPVLDMSVIFGDIVPNDHSILEICNRVRSFQKMVNEKNTNTS